MNRLIFISIIILTFLTVGCFFTDRDYEKKIKVEKYLLTQKQVADFFSDKSINQMLYKELINEKVFVVFHLTNTGNNGAWGKLFYEIDNKYKETIDIKMLGPGKSNSAIIVLPYSGILNPNSIEKPNITVCWKSLNSK